MTLVVVGRTEFWTELTPEELTIRLAIRPDTCGSAHSRLFHSFGGRVLTNIAGEDERALWVWPGDVSAVR